MELLSRVTNVADARQLIGDDAPWILEARKGWLPKRVARFDMKGRFQ